MSWPCSTPTSPGQGGLLLVLEDLYEGYGERVLTTEELLAFLNERSAVPLDDFFFAKIYGGPS